MAKVTISTTPNNKDVIEGALDGQEIDYDTSEGAAGRENWVIIIAHPNGPTETTFTEYAAARHGAEILDIKPED